MRARRPSAPALRGAARRRPAAGPPTRAQGAAGPCRAPSPRRGGGRDARNHYCHYVLLLLLLCFVLFFCCCLLLPSVVLRVGVCGLLLFCPSALLSCSCLSFFSPVVFRLSFCACLLLSPSVVPVLLAAVLAGAALARRRVRATRTMTTVKMIVLTLNASNNNPVPRSSPFNMLGVFPRLLLRGAVLPSTWIFPE